MRRAGQGLWLLCCAALLSSCAGVQPQTEGGRLDVKGLVSLPADLNETSALVVAADGALWTINDSGNGPWLYRLDESGRLDKRVRLKGAANIDWETLANDSRTLYVLDCGNNSGRRKSFQIYRIPLSVLQVKADKARVSATVGRFRYADPAPVFGPQDHDNDCEAATIVDGRLWLLTKGWHTGYSRLYVLDPDAANQQPSSQTELPVGGLVTGADYSGRRHELALVGYRLGMLSAESFIWLIPVREGQLRWKVARRFSLTPAGQWEGIAWYGDELLLTRERSILGGASLGSVAAP